MIVCRLMCRSELETFMRGEEVIKGKNGNPNYKMIVGNKLCFSPIKYCNMISMGDITAILDFMDTLYGKIEIDARKRNSCVYMVVFEDNGKTNFLPSVDNGLEKMPKERCKELQIDSYSKENLKPLRIYEITGSERGRWSVEKSKRTSSEYNVELQDIIRISSYRAAASDMLSCVFNKEQIEQILNGFELPFYGLRTINSLYAQATDPYDRGVSLKYVDEVRRQFYGFGGINKTWSNLDEFMECKKRYLDQQAQKNNAKPSFDAEDVADSLKNLESKELFSDPTEKIPD